MPEKPARQAPVDPTVPAEQEDPAKPPYPAPDPDDVERKKPERENPELR